MLPPAEAVHRYLHPGRIEPVIDSRDRSIGDELAGNLEFVFGQEGDEALAGFDGLATFERQLDPVPRAGEGDAGPARLIVAKDRRLPGGQSQQLFAKPRASVAAKPDRANVFSLHEVSPDIGS